MRSLQQSVARNVMIFMTDAEDGKTGLAGLTLTTTLSKDGGAFASVSPAVTERGNGWYEIAFTTSHTNTVGDLILRATATGADTAEVPMQVVAVLVIPTAVDIAAAVRTNLATELGLVTEIQEKTDNLPAQPAAVGSAMVLSSSGLDAIVVAQPTSRPIFGTSTLVQALAALLVPLINPKSFNKTTRITTHRNIADNATLWTTTATDDGTTRAISKAE